MNWFWFKVGFNSNSWLVIWGLITRDSVLVNVLHQLNRVVTSITNQSKASNDELLVNCRIGSTGAIHWSQAKPSQAKWSNQPMVRPVPFIEAKPRQAKASQVNQSVIGSSGSIHWIQAKPRQAKSSQVIQSAIGWHWTDFNRSIAGYRWLATSWLGPIESSRENWQRRRWLVSARRVEPDVVESTNQRRLKTAVDQSEPLNRIPGSSC